MSWFGRSLVLLLVAAMLCPCAQGRPLPVHPENRFLIDVWETDDGLPENSATAMVQTPDGYLWFGTFNGLVRFDGAQFTVLDPSNTPGFPSPAVLNLHLDQRGRLWVSTDKGIACQNHGVWKVFNRAQGWNSELVRFFTESPTGELIASSWDGHLYRLNGEHFDELPQPVASPAHALSCYFDKNGVLWAANAAFYGSWDGKNWKPADHAWAPGSFDVASPGQNQTLLVLAKGKILRMAGPELVETRELAEPIVECWQLREDNQQAIWAASYRFGLSIIQPNGSLTRLSTAEGLSYDALRFTFEGREGNIWVGTSGGGLMRLKRRSFISLGVAEGLPDRVAKSVWPTANGQILVGTHGGGAAHIQNEKAIPIRENGGMPGGAYVLSAIEDTRGQTWLGCYEQGLTVLRGGRQDHIDQAPRTIYALFEDSNRSIWAGGEGAALRYDGADWQRFAAADGLGLERVRCFAEDPRNGVIWAGGTGGLFRFADGVWNCETNVSATQVWSLYFDAKGALWVGTFRNGLYRLKDGLAARIGTEQGLGSDSISAIIEDELGFLWFGSNRGILRAKKNDLESFAETRKGRIFCRVFTQSDGLASIECAGGIQPAACRDAEGRLWFATLKGVVSADPASVRLNPIPPPLAIQQVVAGGRNHLSAPVTSISPAPELKLEPGTRRLQIHYAALNYTAPEKVRFHYKLEGADTAWIDVGNRRVVYFSDVAPGTYRFKVKASNNDGVWNDGGMSVDFTILPYFWQTFWFRAFLLSFISGLVAFTAWWISRFRLRQTLEKLEREKQLSQVQQRLALVLENTSDFVAFADANRKPLFLNRAGRRLLGVNDDFDITAEATGDIYPAWARNRVESEGLPTALREGVWEGETALRHHLTGREIPVSQVILAHRNPDGSLKFTSTIARDMSAVKTAEKALRETEERFRQIAENLQDVLWIMDSHSRKTIYVSPAFAGVWQRPVEDILQNRIHLLETVHPDDREAVSQKFAELPDGPLAPIEYRIVRPDGSIAWIRDRAFPIRNETGQIYRVAGIAENITARKSRETAHARLEDQLRQAQKMEAIGQLAGGVAHDFNNILTVILGNAALLQDSGRSTTRTTDSSAEIIEAAERAANLTRQLLTFSRRQTVKPRLLDLNAVIANVTKMLMRLIGEHISLHTHYAETGAWVNADAGMMEQIIINLSVNSRDAMPAGGKLRISTTIVSIEANAESRPGARAGEFICLTVEDTGDGIGPEDLPHLFEPFFTTKEVGKGTGLGLATVFGIVEQHKGWIEVQSEQGSGTAMKVFLPQVSPAASDQQKRVPGWQASRGQETILVVEDEQALRDLVGGVLRQHGYTVIEAASGPKALAV
ncbi:MAG TPA: two-component regulator propeller domain-containing protein, partial [Verrucomicrobiae bacterium]|nr:two-component regulator propeller domain-containing protein [Verrucomicrobiae bacterium]